MTGTLERPAPTVSEAMQQRLAAFARLDQGPRNDVEYALIRELALDVGSRLKEFTAADLREHLDASVNANRIGRVFSALVREGRIVELGWRRSTVPSSKARKIGVYRLAS